MQNLDLILTLTGGFAAALIFGYITHKIGLSPIVGYLLAGIMVSPHTPGFVANADLAQQLAEIGVILLMFGVGLQFHVKEFWAVRRVALPGALIQSLVTATLGAFVMHWLGWDWPAAIVFGLAISVASTVVMTRILSDNNELHTQAGRIALGWLVVEDLFTIFVLVLLPVLFGPGGAGTAGILPAFAFTAVKIVLLVAFTFVVGGYLIPRILTNIANTHSRELFTLAILAIALSIAVGSAYMFDVSMALGAFLAGMVVGQSDFSLRAATDAIPLRDAFAVLFFVSVGMLFDWGSLIQTPGLVLATLAIILIGKPLVAFITVIFLKYPLKTAISVALVLSQIGEFSFILATMGTGLAILPAQAQNVLVAAAIISITLNPLLFKAGSGIERWLNRHVPDLSARINARCAPAGDSAGGEAPRAGASRVIVVGYGPVGKIITGLLRKNDVCVTVAELNLQTIQELRSEKIPAVYGDAARLGTLTEAGVATAAALIVSVPDFKEGLGVLKEVKEINPKIMIAVRTTYLSDRQGLKDAGADIILSDEGEVALSVTEMILKKLGATPEQIDLERKIVHETLFPAAPGGNPEDP